MERSEHRNDLNAWFADWHRNSETYRLEYDVDTGSWLIRVKNLHPDHKVECPEENMMGAHIKFLQLAAQGAIQDALYEAYLYSDCNFKIEYEYRYREGRPTHELDEIIIRLKYLSDEDE